VRFLRANASGQTRLYGLAAGYSAALLVQSRRWRRTPLTRRQCGRYRPQFRGGFQSIPSGIVTCFLRQSAPGDALYAIRRTPVHATPCQNCQPARQRALSEPDASPYRRSQRQAQHPRPSGVRLTLFLFCRIARQELHALIARQGMDEWMTGDDANVTCLNAVLRNRGAKALGGPSSIDRLWQV